MNFYWNDWSLLNLILDGVMTVGLLLFTRRRLKRKGLRLLPDRLSRVYTKEYAAAVLWFFVIVYVISALPLFIPTFIRIRYWWLLLTVLAPALCFLLSMRFRIFAPLVLAALCLAVKYYAEVYEPSRLDVEHIRVATPAIDSGLRVAHITDLQTDGIQNPQVQRTHADLRKALVGFRPDLILFTGDVANHPRALPEIYAYLREILSATGARGFFVSGDHDGIVDLGEFERRSGFEILDNRAEILRVGQQRVGLIGLGIHSTRAPELLQKLRNDVASDQGNFVVLLCHRPDCAFDTAGLGINLVVAGHTHGGQVALPWFGPPMTLTRIPRRIAAGGLHSFGDTHLLITRGTGFEGHVAPRIRFLCRPHVSLLRLKPDAPQSP